MLFTALVAINVVFDWWWLMFQGCSCLMLLLFFLFSKIMICHMWSKYLWSTWAAIKPWLVALHRGCTILLQVIYIYIYMRIIYIFVSHEIRLVVRPSQDFMVHVTDWLNVSIAHMSCMFHHLLLILYQSTDGQFGCLGWWFGFQGSSYDRDCYLGVPDSNPKPPGPKPAIYH